MLLTQGNKKTTFILSEGIFQSVYRQGDILVIDAHGFDVLALVYWNKVIERKAITAALFCSAISAPVMQIHTYPRGVVHFPVLWTRTVHKSKNQFGINSKTT